MALNQLMVDIETTGLSPDHAAIIQIGAIKFDLDNRKVGAHFDQALAMPANRFWDESTKIWWGKHPKIYAGIVAKMMEPAVVMANFHAWLLEDVPEGGYQFWAKPSHFDYPFVASYMRQYGYELNDLAHFRVARDLNSFLAGTCRSAEHVKVDLPAAGMAHSALHDAAHQIDALFVHLGNTK